MLQMELPNRIFVMLKPAINIISILKAFEIFVFINTLISNILTKYVHWYMCEHCYLEMFPVWCTLWSSSGIYHIVKPVLSGHSKIDKTKVLKTRQGRRRRSGRTASAGPLFWTSMISTVSLFSRFGSFFFVIFNLLMQSSITLVARVIHRPT